MFYSFVPTRYGHDESFWVCGTCFVLYGGGGSKRRRCRCSVKKRGVLTGAALQQSGTHWHHLAEICRCCGAQVVNASTKYEKWFCPACLHRIDRLNRNCGSCAIPVGWHSLVNGVQVSTRSFRASPGKTAAADQLDAFFDASGGVWEWGRSVVERQWSAVGLPLGRSIGIEEYLEAVGATGLDEVELFEELATARGVPSQYWPREEMFQLQLVWHSDGDQWHSASEKIIWEHDDRRVEYAELLLRVASDPQAQPGWWLSLPGVDVDEPAPILARGSAPTVDAAKEDCEKAAARLIRQQERRLR